MSKIRIANPRPGCAKFTTESQAARLVASGKAVLFGRTLEFLSEADQANMRRIEKQLSQERTGSDVYMAGKKFEIVIKKNRAIPFGPAFPVVQFLRGAAQFESQA